MSTNSHSTKVAASPLKVPTVRPTHSVYREGSTGLENRAYESDVPTVSVISPSRLLPAPSRDHTRPDGFNSFDSPFYQDGNYIPEVSQVSYAAKTITKPSNPPPANPPSKWKSPSAPPFPPSQNLKPKPIHPIPSPPMKPNTPPKVPPSSLKPKPGRTAPPAPNLPSRSPPGNGVADVRSLKAKFEKSGNA